MDAPSQMQVAAAAAVHRLVERSETLATAESLTGGLIAATVVEIPGVSSVYRGGLVVYATDLKHALAGVAQELLAERGPVDPEVALALAAGARQRCVADWGVATTGVAGPDPQDGKPPGLVYVAVASKFSSAVRELKLDGNRAAVRAESVTSVLRLLSECLREAPPVS